MRIIAFEASADLHALPPVTGTQALIMRLPCGKTEEEEQANVEEFVFTSGKENEPRVPKASSGRSALREARLAAQQAAKGGEPELCKQEGNAQPCQSSFVDAFALD